MLLNHISWFMFDFIILWIFRGCNTYVILYVFYGQKMFDTKIAFSIFKKNFIIVLMNEKLIIMFVDS